MGWNKTSADGSQVVTVGVLGAHGGAGTTTLARALGLPELDLAGAGCAEVVVLVAAGHGHGGEQLVRTAAALGPDPRIVVALTSTGWWTAPGTRGACRLLADRVEAVVRLPWVWRWHDTTPTTDTATTRWRRAALDLAGQIESSTTTPEGAHL